MNHDNIILNVNGQGLPMLTKALELAFLQHGENTTAKSFSYIKNVGMVLSWWNNESEKSLNALIVPMRAIDVARHVYQWLESEEALKLVKFEDDDADLDHDGSNSLGWRVYNEKWGHAGNIHSAICAIRPVYLWHGK